MYASKSALRSVVMGKWAAILFEGKRGSIIRAKKRAGINMGRLAQKIGGVRAFYECF